MPIPAVPWHFVRWLREHRVPIATTFDRQGRLQHLQIGAPGDPLPQEAVPILMAIARPVRDVIAELYVPTLDGVCPDGITLKRRADGIKGTWQIGGATHVKVWLRPAVKRRRKARRRG